MLTASELQAWHSAVEAAQRRLIESRLRPDESRASTALSLWRETMFRKYGVKISAAVLGAFFAFGALAPQTSEAAALSNYFQNKFIDWLLRAQTFTPPATVYVALATVAPTAANTTSCGTEVTGGSYARVAVTSSLANWAGTQSAGSTTASTGTSGQTSNNGTITFPAPTANWGTVVGFCLMDAATNGNMLIFAPLTTSKTVNNGDAAPSFAIGALTYTIT